MEVEGENVEREREAQVTPGEDGDRKGETRVYEGNT